MDDNCMWMHICMYIQVHVCLVKHMCMCVFVCVDICLCVYNCKHVNVSVLLLRQLLFSNCMLPTTYKGEAYKCFTSASTFSSQSVTL